MYGGPIGTREMHAYEMHANEVHPPEMHAREVHASEMICFGAAPPPVRCPILTLAPNLLLKFPLPT